MKRIFTSKQNRTKLEKDILKQIKDIRSGLSAKLLKNMDVTVQKTGKPIKDLPVNSIPYDRDKARDVVEAFLKLKSSKMKH